MPRQKLGFRKHIRRFLVFPGIIGIILLSQIYACKEDENLPPLEIHSVDPPQAEIGDTIRLIGQGFSPGYNYNHVIFSGGTDTYSLTGSNTQTLLVPIPDAAVSGPITVNILDVETAQSPTIEIIPPVIDEVVPAEAWVGDTVIFRGAHFQLNKARNNVKFGTADADGIVVSATKTELKVIVPGLAQNGPVRVMGFNGPNFKLKPSVVESLVPDHGGVGDTVMIKGKGLVVYNVVFKPSQVATLLRDKNTSRCIYAIVPPGAVDGHLIVKSSVSGQDADVETPQSFLVYPTIREFTPLSGSAGVPVTITGYNFSTIAAENVVSFNGTIAAVTSATATQLVLEVPAGFSTGPVTVTVNGRTVTGPVFSVAEPGAPVIFSVSPRSGPIGSRVLITGTDFGSTPGANTVKFGGNMTAGIVSASATQLVVEVPAGAHTGQITVTKEGKTGIGSVFTITTDAIPFIASVEPAIAGRNETITLKGANFNRDAGGFTVQTGSGQPFSVVSVAPDQVVARVPATISLGDNTIMVGQAGKLSNAVPFQVSGNPVITSLSVSEGVPGAVLVITGNDFNPDESKNIVKFGDTQATVVNPGDQDDSKVTVYVPNLAAQTYSVTLTTLGKTTTGVDFTIKPQTQPVRAIIYGESDETTPATFRVIRRTSDPPSQTTIYSVPQGLGTNALALDPPRNRAFFVDGEGFDISRVNLDGTGKAKIYPAASPNGGYVYDLSIDAQHQKIYFTEDETGIGAIYSGDMNGTTPPETVIDFGALGDRAPVSLAYVPENDRLYIYAAYGGSAGIIELNPADPTNPRDIFTFTDDGNFYARDLKIDVSAQKIFVLDEEMIIRTGNLDGSGSLTTLATRSQRIIGMAIDVIDQYVYWMEVSPTDVHRASVYRMKYDHSTIPGTDPPTAEEQVYTNIITRSGTQGVSGLALDGDNGSGSSQRSGISFSGFKVRKLISPNTILHKPIKKARPGK